MYVVDYSCHRLQVYKKNVVRLGPNDIVPLLDRPLSLRSSERVGQKSVDALPSERLRPRGDSLIIRAG